MNTLMNIMSLASVALVNILCLAAVAVPVSLLAQRLLAATAAIAASTPLSARMNASDRRQALRKALASPDRRRAMLSQA